MKKKLWKFKWDTVINFLVFFYFFYLFSSKCMLFYITENIQPFESHFYYIGELVNWDLKPPMSFSFEDMAIFSNRTVVYADEETNKKYILDTGQKPLGICCPPYAHNVTNCTYTVLHNIFVTAFAGIGYIDQQIITVDIVKNFHTPATRGVLNCTIPCLIAVGHRWCRVFGHVIYDVLPLMLFIPENVKQTAKVLLSVNNSMYRQLYVAIGFREDQIINIPREHFIYAQVLHTVISMQALHNNMVYGLKWVGDTIKKYCKTENIEPKYIGLQNRLRGPRKLSNFNRFVAACQEKFKQENILRLPDLHSNLNDAAKDFASLRIYCAPTGSNFANMIYMKEGCGLVVALAGMEDLPIIAASQNLHFWTLTFNVKGLSHWESWVTAPINITQAIIAIETVDYAVTHQKWNIDRLIFDN